MGTSRAARSHKRITTGFYEVRLVDEQGAGLAGLTVEIAAPDGTKSARTDENGVARVEDVVAGMGGVRVDPAAVQRELDGRPRRAGPVGAAASREPPPLVHVKDPEAFGSWTPIRANERHTLVFRAYFSVVELAGAAFDPNDAFPGPAAFAQVAALHERLAGGRRLVTLFGHAEPGGGEELRLKVLSERRAQAVFGLLAHRPEVWEDLWKKEQWSLKPQILTTMLEALGFPIGQYLRQSIAAFQASRPPLATDGNVGPETRAVLFRAYFELASKTPLEEQRFVRTQAATAPWMGCGDLNRPALRNAGARGRRVEAFVFDPAAAPAPPCALNDLRPCRAFAVNPADRAAGCRAYHDLTKKADGPASRGGAHEVAFEARCARTERPLAYVDFAVETYFAESGYMATAHGRTDENARATVEVPAPGGYRVRVLYRPLLPWRPSTEDGPFGAGGTIKFDFPPVAAATAKAVGAGEETGRIAPSEEPHEETGATRERELVAPKPVPKPKLERPPVLPEEAPPKMAPEPAPPPAAPPKLTRLPALPVAPASAPLAEAPRKPVRLPPLSIPPPVEPPRAPKPRAPSRPLEDSQPLPEFPPLPEASAPRPSPPKPRAPSRPLEDSQPLPEFPPLPEASAPRPSPPKPKPRAPARPPEEREPPPEIPPLAPEDASPPAALARPLDESARIAPPSLEPPPPRER